MTDLDLDAIKARAEAATPGPWGGAGEFDRWLAQHEQRVKAEAWQEGFNDSERSWKHIYDGHDTTWEDPETCVSCVTRNPYKEEA